MANSTAADILRPTDIAFLASQRKQMLIDGELVESASGKYFETWNPATGEVLAQVAEAGQEDIDRAVRAARKAFHGVWGKVKPSDRQRFLLRLADLIEKNADELAILEVLDTGMPISLARSALIPRAAEQVRYYAGWATKIHGETIDNSAAGNFFSYTLREPVGVVGAIVPWNSPFVITIWKLAPALAAGCTLVLKPAEQTPLTALRLGELLLEAGFPNGVVNICPGFGSEAGAALAAHADVDKIAFTGSYQTGQSIIRASASNLKRVSLELGGKSPDIVFADADLDRAIPGAAWAIFRLSGQICCGGSRLFVEQQIYDRFLSKLSDFSASIKVGNGLDPNSEMGPLISSEQFKRVNGYIQSGLEEGAKLVCGGERLLTGDLRNGYFMPPTVFDNVKPDNKIAQEEIFGPVICVIPFKEFDEVLALSNNTSYGLAGGVWTQNVQKAHAVAKALQAGVVWVNCFNVMDPAVPFGGCKMSGYGRDSGADALEQYTQVKSVWVNVG
ncbi:MAG: aldehyde dehydrogenase family protein [Candidatus Sulfotelmatobacter sp.]